MAGVPNARILFDGSNDPAELALRKGINAPAKSAAQVTDDHAAFVEEMTKATIEGLNGGVAFDTSHEVTTAIQGPMGDVRTVMPIARQKSRSADVRKAVDSYEMAKSVGDADFENFAKEWTLGNPLSNTGLVPYDLEAPAKLLTPRPTPIRNSTPRLKGQGASRQFKVISGFTGTGTGGATTVQSGINETTTNTGPGGLSYIRGPYINYAGYNVNLPYVTTSLSDSVSWQAEYQGQGFEDIRSLSNTALLYSTMLIDERLMVFGRGSQTGYAGALGTPGAVTLAPVSASIAPAGGTGGTALSTVSWVVVAADAGDLLGVNGQTMHQGPVTSITSAASVTLSAGQAIQVTVGTDVAGALGYNLFVASVQAGPFFYAGRTGYNVGYIKTQPSTGPFTSAGAADQSAVANNYDGLLTNVAASGGYVTRLNSAFSTTNPGVEYQVAFGNLYESVKGDPEVIWMNGFDRLQLSNALLNSSNVNAFRIVLDQTNGKGGAVIQSIMNEVTGTEVPITVHPWFPQGNSLIQQKTLPIPDSNVSETSVIVAVQDYTAVQWPVTQFTYDASTFEISTMCHYAPAWNGLISGIQGVGIGTTPPSFGDS